MGVAIMGQTQLPKDTQVSTSACWGLWGLRACVRSLRHETKGKRAQGTVGRLKLSDTRQDTTQRGAARVIGGGSLLQWKS